MLFRSVDGTETTLAETLWEEDEPVRFDAQDQNDEAKSPVAARGTGMTRSPSGGVLLRDLNPGTASKEGSPAVPDGPFARILGRLSGEIDR